MTPQEADDALIFAQLSLAKAPAEHAQSLVKTAKARQTLASRSRFIQRALPEGSLVARFVFATDWCPRYNELLKKHFGTKSTLGAKVRRALTSQGCPSGPLPGRPLVRFVRFSTIRPDRDSSWTKVPLDELVNAKLIKNDDELSIDLRAWWEPAPRNRQCVYVDIWTGKEDA